MRAALNYLSELCFQFTPVLLLYTSLHAGSCKNSAARKTSTILKDIKQDNTDPTSLKQDKHKDQDKTDLKASKLAEKDSEATISSQNSMPNKWLQNSTAATNEQDIKPTFTLKDITIQVGTSQSITLAVTGLTEGYIIKSVSITNNTTTRYIKQFGLDDLKNKTIPSSGLAFELTANKSLKLGTYLLQIKLGKTGADSQKTEQFVGCTITVFDQNEVKTNDSTDKQNDFPNSNQLNETQTETTPFQGAYAIKQEHKEQKDTTGKSITHLAPSTHNPVGSLPTTSSQQPINEVQENLITCLFFPDEKAISTTHRIRCKIGANTTIYYDTEDDQTDYQIKSLQIIKENNRISTSKKLFGLDHLNKTFAKRISLSPTIQQPGNYQLILKIKRPGNQPLLTSKCNLELFK